jgi:hypothetical protein
MHFAFFKLLAEFQVSVAIIHAKNEYLFLSDPLIPYVYLFR